MDVIEKEVDSTKKINDNILTVTLELAVVFAAGDGKRIPGPAVRINLLRVRRRGLLIPGLPVNKGKFMCASSLTFVLEGCG